MSIRQCDLSEERLELVGPRKVVSRGEFAAAYS